MECNGSLLVYPSLRDTCLTLLFNSNLSKHRGIYKPERRKTVLHEMVKSACGPKIPLCVKRN